MPGMGHRRPHLTAADVRFWTHPPHLVVYRERTPLEIVRVLHERRDIARILADDE